jgi:hypothetical protein
MRSLAEDVGMHLLMIASAPLYVGPLVAGWIGMGWEGLPVFVALTALWLVVMRPRVWPHNLADWTRATALSAAAQLAVNALIVAVLFGVGRALGAISELEPALSPYFPIALSFLATPLSRLAWNPAVQAEPGHLVLATAIGGDSAEMVEALLALPPDTDAALIEPALDTLFSGPEAAARYSRLEHALGLDHRHGRRDREGTGDAGGLMPCPERYSKPTRGSLIHHAHLSHRSHSWRRHRHGSRLGRHTGIAGVRCA